MRINAKMVEARAANINRGKKIIHVCQRNNYWAIDTVDEKECIECGMSTREIYAALAGIIAGMRLAKDL